jgi:hypothetical protein
MIDGIFAALVLETPTCDLYGRASDETQRAMVELFAVEVVQCDTVATGDARRFTRTQSASIERPHAQLATRRRSAPEYR